MNFETAVQHLHAGDFSFLEPQFTGDRPQITAWLEEGKFQSEPAALAEALTCACFLNKTEVAEKIIQSGVAPNGGNETGLDAIHWASNRGQLAAVELLLRHNVDVEVKSSYGGTALGTVVWSVLNEPRGEQLAVVERLLEAGADLAGAHLAELGFPTANEELNKLIARRVSE